LRQPPDMDRAINEFRDSLKRDPNHEKTLVNLTIALSKKGEVKEAQATLAQLEKAHPNSSALPKLRERLEAVKSEK
jgi:TolA-binding protein